MTSLAEYGIKPAGDTGRYQANGFDSWPKKVVYDLSVEQEKFWKFLQMEHVGVQVRMGEKLKEIATGFRFVTGEEIEKNPLANMTMYEGKVVEIPLADSSLRGNFVRFVEGENFVIGNDVRYALIQIDPEELDPKGEFNSTRSIRVMSRAERLSLLLPYSRPTGEALRVSDSTFYPSLIADHGTHQTLISYWGHLGRRELVTPVGKQPARVKIAQMDKVPLEPHVPGAIPSSPTVSTEISSFFDFGIGLRAHHTMALGDVGFQPTGYEVGSACFDLTAVGTQSEKVRQKLTKAWFEVRNTDKYFLPKQAVPDLLMDILDGRPVNNLWQENK